MRFVIASLLSIFFSHSLSAQNSLSIPPLLDGKEFLLEVQTGTRELVPGFQTPTYGVNGPFLAPTLLLHKGDSVTLNVKNNIGTTTTMHWHGLHVPAMFDGGPHQIIKNGATWSPRIKVMNDAGTFWYHPHGEGKTEIQVGKGLAGMIIVRDSLEESLGLPRTYGVDDIPVIIQSKGFDELHQIAIATEMDTLMLTNGTPHAVADLPAQVVRLRLLNGSSMRTYNIGISDNRSFMQIACDDGLLTKALSTTRVRIAPGERVEILIRLSDDKGRTLDLMNYGSELTTGIYGAATVGMGMAQIPDYANNPLNGGNFSILKIRIGDATTGAIQSYPTTLASYTPFTTTQAKRTRSLEFTPEQMGMKYMVEGPFLINGSRFDMDVVNIGTHLNDVEIWSLKNSTLIAHPFHIHNQYVYILDRDGRPVAETESGKKDVILVLPQQTVRFITKFEDFTDATTPYMYHCHMLHHEDDGMMGTFTVTQGPTEVVTLDDTPCLYPNPVDGVLMIKHQGSFVGPVSVEIVDLHGRVCVHQQFNSAQESYSIDTKSLLSGWYSLHMNFNAGRRVARVCVIH